MVAGTATSWFGGVWPVTMPALPDVLRAAGQFPTLVFGPPISPPTLELPLDANGSVGADVASRLSLCGGIRGRGVCCSIAGR